MHNRPVLRLPVSNRFDFKAIKSTKWENMNRDEFIALCQKSAKHLLAAAYVSVPGGIIDQLAILLDFEPHVLHDRLAMAVRNIKENETGGTDEFLLDIIESITAF